MPIDLYIVIEYCMTGFPSISGLDLNIFNVLNVLKSSESNLTATYKSISPSSDAVEQMVFGYIRVFESPPEIHELQSNSKLRN